jgi:hypothetical protein
MQIFMARSANDGALPTLRAAAEGDATRGSYYGPKNWLGSRGPPVVVSIPKPALDEAARKKLWEMSEDLTGVRWSPLLLTTQT